MCGSQSFTSELENAATAAWKTRASQNTNFSTKLRQNTT